MYDPFNVVREFEQALCEYTGAPYCVTTTSCTMAILLAMKYQFTKTDKRIVEVPKQTYVGVPMSVINAGGYVRFTELLWNGSYQLYPYDIYDFARELFQGMYGFGMCCLSFHWTKQLSIGQGGAILHDDPEADAWLRAARFDGRTEGFPVSQDNINVIGLHCYMSPRDAAEGLTRLSKLPKLPDPLPDDDYPDLSKMEVFREYIR